MLLSCKIILFIGLISFIKAGCQLTKNNNNFIRSIIEKLVFGTITNLYTPLSELIMIFLKEASSDHESDEKKLSI